MGGLAAAVALAPTQGQGRSHSCLLAPCCLCMPCHSFPADPTLLPNYAASLSPPTSLHSSLLLLCVSRILLCSSLGHGAWLQPSPLAAMLAPCLCCRAGLEPYCVSQAAAGTESPGIEQRYDGGVGEGRGMWVEGGVSGGAGSKGQLPHYLFHCLPYYLHTACPLPPPLLLPFPHHPSMPASYYSPPPALPHAPLLPPSVSGPHCLPHYCPSHHLSSHPLQSSERI